jgi:hypothetical protein
VFFRFCVAQELRRVLVDRARARRAEKRGGGAHRTELRSALLGGEESPVELRDLDAALCELDEPDGRKARVVELRVCAALTDPECAEELGAYPRTVDGDWAFSLAWLRRRLAEKEKP